MGFWRVFFVFLPPACLLCAAIYHVSSVITRRNNYDLVVWLTGFIARTQQLPSTRNASLDASKEVIYRRMRALRMPYNNFQMYLYASDDKRCTASIDYSRQLLFTSEINSGIRPYNNSYLLLRRVARR